MNHSCREGDNMNGETEKNEKGELLHEINSMLEVLPACDCQEIKEYILGFYLA